MTKIDRELMDAAWSLLQALDDAAKGQLAHAEASGTDHMVQAKETISKADGPLSNEDKRHVITQLIEGAILAAEVNPALNQRVRDAADTLRAVLVRAGSACADSE